MHDLSHDMNNNSERDSKIEITDKVVVPNTSKSDSPELFLPMQNEASPILLATPKTAWQDLPVPEGPDKHEPYFEKSCACLSKLNLIGARVRGKSHKHVGTNCDDWFEFDVCQDWVIIAAADGVGSRKLSRVGAKTACRTAVSTLREYLKPIKLITRTDLKQFRGRGKDGRYLDADMNNVEQALFRAIDNAYHAIEEARDIRKEKLEYLEYLGHEPEVHDFSTTLLLAVHNSFVLCDKIYDFIMSLQVGDGMIAAVNVDNKLKLLGKPDSGEFAGEVIPLTNKKLRDDREKRHRVFSTVQRMKALLLMTDGVADDYFPNDPEMLQLYRDLIKEHIINSSENPNEDYRENNQELAPTEARLRKWLDSYTVKGSFDDRTLVVLFREANQ